MPKGPGCSRWPIPKARDVVTKIGLSPVIPSRGQTDIITARDSRRGRTASVLQKREIIPSQGIKRKASHYRKVCDNYSPRPPSSTSLLTRVSERAQRHPSGESL